MKSTISLSSYDYGEYTQHAPDNNSLSCLGPRVLFDKNFVPPKIIPRSKKAAFLHDVIFDALHDGFSTNVNFYGIKGIGKSLAVNHFLNWMQAQEAHLIQKEPIRGKKSNSRRLVCFLRIDCGEKDITQFFFEILSQLGQQCGFSFNLKEISASSPSTLWNLLKTVILKCPSPIIAFLQRAEFLNQTVLNKLFVFAHEIKSFQIITSMNTGFRQYGFNQIPEMDHKIQMGLLEMPDLLQITADRSKMAFPQPVASDANMLVLDYVSEFDIKVPGACVGLLKSFYPIVQECGHLNAEHIRAVSQYHFEGFSLDSIRMAEFVFDTSIEDRLFLDYLIQHFRVSENYYIRFEKIQQCYKMVSEELEFTPKKDEFHHSLKKIMDAEILRPSSFQISQGAIKTGGIYPVNYFLTIPVDDVVDLMDSSFGNVGEDPEFFNL